MIQQVDRSVIRLLLNNQFIISPFFKAKIWGALENTENSEIDCSFFILLEKDIPYAGLHLKEGEGTLLVLKKSTNLTNDLNRIPRLTFLSGERKWLTSYAQFNSLELKTGPLMAYFGSPYNLQKRFFCFEKANLGQVASLLRSSHAFYKNHLIPDLWVKNMRKKNMSGHTLTYQISIAEEVVATASIERGDETTTIISNLAVHPSFRRKGLASILISQLVNQIINDGKIPRLLSGTEEATQLYKKLGFVKEGYWGQCSI